VNLFCQPNAGYEAWTAYCNFFTQSECNVSPASDYCFWTCDGQPGTPSIPNYIPLPIYGYFSWSWSTGSTGPSDANVGISFTGYVDVNDAVTDYPDNVSYCCPTLTTPKLVTLGGDGKDAIFTEAALTSIEANLSQIVAAGYAGVVFDIESVTGSSEVMVPAFESAFAAC